MHSFTVNHQPWDGVGDTYVIALVTLAEQDDLRLTTNLVDIEPGGRAHRHAGGSRLRGPRSRLSAALSAGDDMTAAERRAIISGIGQSDVGRRLGRGDLDLTIDAALAAIADAGLTVGDIDGLATYPGGMTGPGLGGFSGPGTPAVQDALRLSLQWHSGGPEGPAQLQAVVNAVMAVSMGLARHVLVYRTVTESTAQGSGRRQGIGVGAKGVGGAQQWSIPFRAYSAANWLALYAQRHFHEFGTTREQMAQIALTARTNAGRNPEGGLPRSPFAGGLSQRPDDLRSALPARLRRAGRRLDRARGVGRRTCGGRGSSGGSGRSGGHRACVAAPPGISGTT